MKKRLLLNIVLSLALGGMSAALFAEDAAKPADTAAAPAEEAKPADIAAGQKQGTEPEVLKEAEKTEQAAASNEAGKAEAKEESEVAQAGAEAASATTAGDNLSASVAPTDVAEFHGQISEIGGAAPDTTSTAPEIKHRLDGAALDRNYFQQPPLIPHKIDEYRITANNNKCMSCHGWDKYKASGATKISQTHFKDRDGKDHSTLAARRYFCTQCHVPQVDAAPLIENEFKPVDELSQ